MKKRTVIALSNSFFLVPLTLSVLFELYIMTAIILASTVSSTLYHVSGKKLWDYTDMVLAITLITANFYLLFSYKSTFPYTYLTWLMIVLTVWLYVKGKGVKYKFYHSAWHVSSAILTAVCLLGFHFS